MALGGRFGGREIERNGGLANSIGPAPARVDMAAAWERKRLPEYAQRTEIPSRIEWHRLSRGGQVILDGQLDRSAAHRRR